MMADLTKDMTDAQKIQFFIENRSELIEMAKRIGTPGTHEQVESAEMAHKKELDWCTQNPDPGIQSGDLRQVNGEYVTIIAVNRHLDGLREYEFLRNGHPVYSSARFIEVNPQ
jgi:hypothetical protein